MALVLHPAYELYEKKHVPFCSSLQVVDAFEKLHKNVLRDIEALSGQQKFVETECNQLKIEPVDDTPSKSGQIDVLADFFKNNFKRTKYTDKKGEKRPMYLMTKDGFTLLTMGFTGEKAMRFKIEFIKRFNEMEQFIRNHLLSCDDFPPFTQAVKDAHDEPQSYHYSNEINMIYRIVLGMDAKAFRELHNIEQGGSIRPFLTDAEYKTVRKLQTEDIRLLYKGADYDTRKQALFTLFMNKYAEAINP